jgi:hypothetical protein
MIPASALVVGCSEQLPNELRAYRLMGTSSDGAVLLSRHGATYSAAASEVSAYPEVLEHMLGLVLAGLPASARERARQALINRWNRDWGVEAEDLEQLGTGSANDNGSGPATEEVETSTSPFVPAQPRIDGDGSFGSRHVVTVAQQSCAHG